MYKSPTFFAVKNVHCASPVMKHVTSTLSSSATAVDNCMLKLQSNCALIILDSRFDNNNVNIIEKLSTTDEICRL